MLRTCRRGRHFAVDACDISILHEPREFYDALMQGVSSAIDRVSLSSLYIGTGQLESALLHNLKAKVYHCRSVHDHQLLAVRYVCKQHARL